MGPSLLQLSSVQLLHRCQGVAIPTMRTRPTVSRVHVCLWELSLVYDASKTTWLGIGKVASKPQTPGLSLVPCTSYASIARVPYDWTVVIRYRTHLSERGMCDGRPRHLGDVPSNSLGNERRRSPPQLHDIRRRLANQDLPLCLHLPQIIGD